MSIAAIHDRIMVAAKIESAQILLPSGSRCKQNFRARLSAGCGYQSGRDGCPPGRSGRPLRRRGYLSEPGYRSGLGYLSGPDGSLAETYGSLSGRRGCPSGGQV